MGKNRQLRGGEKGSREKAQPSKKKDRAVNVNRRSVTDYKGREIEDEVSVVRRREGNARRRFFRFSARIPYGIEGC